MDATGLETLSDRELHERAVRYAVRHGDVGFLWKLLKVIPAAEAASGHKEETTADLTRVSALLSDAITALGSKFPALAEVCAFVSQKMGDSISDLAYGSVFLNSSKLHAAESYVSDSEGVRGGFKHAYTTLSQGEAVVHGTKAQIAADALREGLKMNSIQNGSTTAGSLHKDEPEKPQIDLPL